MRCRHCPFSEPFGPQYEGRHVTTIVFDKPEWLRNLESGKDQVVRKERLIREECPACGNGEMYYWQLQIRSADEGSTVFYKCPKC